MVSFRDDESADLTNSTERYSTVYGESKRERSGRWRRRQAVLYMPGVFLVEWKAHFAIARLRLKSRALETFRLTEYVGPLSVVEFMGMTLTYCYKVAYHPSRTASRAPHQSLKSKGVDNSKASDLIGVEAVEPCLPMTLQHQQEPPATTESRCQQELIEPIFNASIAVAVKRNSWINHRSSPNVVTHVL